jgi:taurine--2-oxoglutarate transaminase
MSLETIDKIIAASDPQQLLDWNKKYMLHLAPVKSVIVKDGEGCIFTDTQGKKYIDFRSQSTSCPLGYRNKKVNDAMKEQLDRISAGIPDFLNEPLLKLARLMAEIAPKG